MGTISVVVPTYNRAHTLPRAIDSVLNQSYSDLELIIVDDGSTDGTKDVVNGYSDRRIHFVELKLNKGANAARNEGIQRARGKYLSFLDSDDEFTTDHLEKAISHLKESSETVKGVYTSQVTYSDNSVQSSSIANTRLTSPGQVIRDYQANGFSSFTFFSEVFDQVGLLDEGLAAYQDRDFLIRYLQFYELCPISEILVKYHTHDDQISANPDRKLSALDQLISKHKNLIAGSNSGYLHYSRAFQYVNKRKMPKATAEFAAAVKKNPIKFKYYFQLFSTLFGHTGFKVINKYKSKLLHFIHSFYKRFGNR